MHIRVKIGENSHVFTIEISPAIDTEAEVTYIQLNSIVIFK